MRRIINLICSVIGILGLGACSSDMPVATMETVTKTTETRGPEVVPVIDQKTIEVVKADLIGALEGALKGFDYALNQNLPEEEAIGVITISAITHGVQRSHAAYVTTFVQSGINMGIASTNPTLEFDCLTMSREAVRVAESNQVALNRWITEDPYNLSSNYPHATMVAQTHNAMLSVTDNMDNVKDFESYEASLKNYTPLQRAYLSSDFYVDSFSEVVKEPLNFSAYNNITWPQSHYSAKSVAKSFLNKMDKMSFENTIDEYNKAMKRELAVVNIDPSTSNLEKESIRIGLITGLYSLMYWSEQLHTEVIMK